MEPNAFYFPQWSQRSDGEGKRGCLGRGQELFSLTGIRGFAYQTADNKDMYEFIVDGYTADEDWAVFRLRKENVRFF